jgi:hypothetical protein
MRTYLLTAATADRGFTDWPEAVRQTHAGGTWVDNWRVQNADIEPGDEVFVFKQGGTPGGVVAHGTVTRGSYSHYRNRNGTGGPAFRVVVGFDAVLGPADEALPWPLPGHEYTGRYRGPFASGVPLDHDLAPEMRRLWAEHVAKLKEAWR